jgi:lipopolysaccharide transport system permease protein
VWRYRELLFFLTWRDISVRYKQTALGIAWAVIQPLFTMLAFSLFFGRLAGLSSEGLPYTIFTLCALLPWQLFQFSLTESSNSIVANQSLITKAFFPRLIIPMASTLAGLVDFLIAFVLLAGMMFYYRIVPTASVWLIPLLMLLAVITALGAGLWLSALNVRYRDVRYTIPFLTQFWMFVTPVAYSSAIVPGEWRAIYSLNPMVGVVEGFRWSLLGAGVQPGMMVLVSSIVAIALFVSGAFYFRYQERTFADTV